MDGFVDITAAMGQGVYALERGGIVVFVGRANGMLEMISAHRRLARTPPKPWMPIRGIVFDRVLIQPCHPDRVEALLAAMIAEHDPIYNRPAAVIPLQIAALRRRI